MQPTPSPRTQWRNGDGLIRRARRGWGYGPEWSAPMPQMRGRDYGDPRGPWEQRLAKARREALVQVKRAKEQEARPANPLQAQVDAIVRSMGRVPYRASSQAELRRHRQAVGMDHLHAGLRWMAMRELETSCRNLRERFQMAVAA